MLRFGLLAFCISKLTNEVGEITSLLPNLEKVAPIDLDARRTWSVRA
jgi:hypothetical protein